MKWPLSYRGEALITNTAADALPMKGSCVAGRSGSSMGFCLGPSTRTVNVKADLRARADLAAGTDAVPLHASSNCDLPATARHHAFTAHHTGRRFTLHGFVRLEAFLGPSRMSCWTFSGRGHSHMALKVNTNPTLPHYNKAFHTVAFSFDHSHVVSYMIMPRDIASKVRFSAAQRQ